MTSPAPGSAPLLDEEMAVLRLVAKGLDNRAIATGMASLDDPSA